MRDRNRWLAVCVALAAWGFGAGAAHADRLVTQDGQAIETAGPWRIEGRLVVFERPDGTLASMRRSDVDLEASRRATDEAKAAREAAAHRTETENRAPKHREPIARLTEKELPPVGAPANPPSEATGGAAPDAGAKTDAKDASGLRVLDWTESAYDAKGLGFTGSVRNDSKYTAVGVTVTGHLFNEKDEPSGTATAVLTSSALLPGERADFRATFPGVFSYTKVTFDVDGQLLLNEPKEQAQPGEAGSSDGRPAIDTPDSPPGRDAGSGAGASGG